MITLYVHPESFVAGMVAANVLWACIYTLMKVWPS